MQSCSDGLKLPGSWATPNRRNMNFFIVLQFSQLHAPMASPFTHCYCASVCTKQLRHPFLARQLSTCDNTPDCGASVARNVSKLLGTEITNFVPLLNLSAFD
jgi:hypothetical protein